MQDEKKLEKVLIMGNVMEREICPEDLSELLSRKEREDKGRRHKASKHGGFAVGQYDLAGRLEVEYESLVDAVDRNEVGATYQGILSCIQGRIRKHCGKIWRRGYVSSDASGEVVQDSENQ